MKDPGMKEVPFQRKIVWILTIYETFLTTPLPPPHPLSSYALCIEL